MCDNKLNLFFLKNYLKMFSNQTFGSTRLLDSIEKKASSYEISNKKYNPTYTPKKAMRELFQVSKKERSFLFRRTNITNF